MGFNKSDREEAKKILKENGYHQTSGDNDRYVNDSGKVAKFSETGASVKVDGGHYNDTSNLKKKK